MSHDNHHDTHAHGDDHHDDHHDDGAAHGTLYDYVVGFILSVILTAIPFWLVMEHIIDNKAILSLVLLGLGAVQIVVHMIYFLHMNPRSEGGWNMLALIFTAVIVVITLSGSMWVMHHLHENMSPMPTHMNDI
ncbi:MAG TPA: cytochrome o ubiquinol oxidase subunit IV [Rhodocyclaceae bacterium]|nr:cytochrome o ubiquinol oxidase subunit IV [Rhodocyclaceae bacterium]